MVISLMRTWACASQIILDYKLIKTGVCDQSSTTKKDNNGYIVIGQNCSPKE